MRALRNGLAVTGLLVLCCCAAQASDRPFLSTNSAAAEEDDDNVWSVENSAFTQRSLRGFAIAPEYAFDPVNTLQFELSVQRDRSTRETAQSAGLEAKHLFNHIARDGWAWGLVASIDFGRVTGQGWRLADVGLKLPWSLAFAEGDGLLHLNAGVVKPQDARREFTASAALEYRVTRRSTLFAELAREGDQKLVHGGLRQWLRKDKLALDVGVYRSRESVARGETGFVIGLGFYDL